MVDSKLKLLTQYHEYEANLSTLDKINTCNEKFWFITLNASLFRTVLKKKN